MRTPKITRTRVITTLAVLTLAGCGTTATHPAAHPAASRPAVTATQQQAVLSATAVLNRDGYKPVVSETRAQIEADAGQAAPAILSVAGGLTRDFKRAEVVVIVDTGILNANGGRPALTTMLNAKVKGATSTAEAAGGTTIVRVTGPSGAFTTPATSAPASGDPAAGSGTGAACVTVAGYFPGGLPGHRDSSGFCVEDGTPAPVSSSAPAATATGLANCSGGADNSSTVWAGTSTSCPFALSVAAAYAGHGGPDTETVYSPVTGTSYVITYTVQGAGTVVATGGNGAYVQF